MSKCLLVYYSQGGTTGRLAESVAKGLRASGHDVDLHDLKTGPAPGPDGYDVLGVGTPAYYFRPPFLVTDHLNNLPSLSGKPFFVFSVSGSYLGDTGNIARRALERKGGKDTGYAGYHGAGYFLGYLKRGYLFSPSYPRPETFAQAEQFGWEIAARLSGKAYQIERYDPPTHVVYRIERFLTNKLFVRMLFSRLFRVDENRCTACGVCVRSCPTRNIREDSAGRPVWGRNCLFCFSCQMKCPVDAIDAPVTWFLFRPFLMYNVRRASRDPGLEKARVKHAKGRTRIAE